MITRNREIRLFQRPFGTPQRFSGATVWAKLLSGLLVLFIAGQTLAAEDAKSEKKTSPFLRITHNEKNAPLALETPIVRFVPTKGETSDLTVDLIAAVHIAEKDYYKNLNREFAKYDVVLYELIAPEDAPTPKQTDSAGNHPLTILQTSMQELLGLEYQLKGIDYTCQNMVRADMSPEQFAESMRNRGESLMTMLARMLGYALSEQKGPNNTDLLMALFSQNRTIALRRVLATEFENNEGAMAALGGPKGSTIIEGRNDVALKELRKTIDSGKRKIAVFYGAAHMSHFQKRLQEDFGMKPTTTRWFVAWKLQP
jgi:hypothetical protein